jgi:hypothetical protein
MKEERLMTSHPSGNKSVNILLKRFDVIKAFIIQILGKE